VRSGGRGSVREENVVCEKWGGRERVVVGSIRVEPSRVE
jgi:hypothetical protein